MTIGIALHAVGGTNEIDATVDWAREAASAGVRSAWFGQTLGADALTLATVVGREVPQLHVGTAAIPVFARHPLLTWSQAQTAQAATRGRFHLGLALGTKRITESAYGVPYERPVARLREFLTVLREVRETGHTEFRGELVTAASALPTTVPGADAPIPLLVAAMGPQALRASGELADGILPFLAGPRALGEHIVPAVTAAAERAGRPAPRIAAFVPGIVTSDVARVRAAAVEQLAFYDPIPSYARIIELSGAERAADIAVIGDEEHLAAQIQRYRDAGATEVVVSNGQLSHAEDRTRTWKLLGELAAA
ncbi:LLM class F420-dependent oxidoreductase [Streptomyces sp. NPDC059002]|uniref:LLM class F420-dependent oxidoreductase n=1 Tax=Streptomyces sp. NPDC059002 TaxID=3346690 RepID=UPI0036AD731D